MPIQDLPGYSGRITLINSFIQKIRDAQAEYFIVQKKFFQGLDIVDGQPNGVQPISTNSNKKPGDQEHSWKDFSPTVFALSLALPFNIKVRVYESDSVSANQGWGFIITFEFWRAGLGQDPDSQDIHHWRMRYHEGPTQQSGNFILPYLNGHIEPFQIVPESGEA